MPVKIEGSEMLMQKEIQESGNVECPVIGLADPSESEVQWVKLHQMFDK